jgi:superfamily II DNA or RNA helicase
METKLRKKIKITRLSPIWAEINDPNCIKNYLVYKKEYWQQGQYKKMKQEYSKSLLTDKNKFSANFIPKILKYLENKPDVDVELIDKKFIDYKYTKPKLKGIVFREDQEFAISSLCESIIKDGMGGVWQAPTGSGKTVLISGIVSAIKTRVLIIVHTKSIFSQTRDILVDFFGENNVGVIQSEKMDLNGSVVVAMRQTLSSRMKENKLPSDFNYLWGVIIVDEAHHVSGFDTEYAYILEKIMASARIGFTATMPDKEEAKLAMEAYIGPYRGSTSYEELAEAEVLAKPNIRLILTEENDKYKDIVGGYKVGYDVAIVRNKSRNLQIVELTKEYYDQGKSVLIMVEKVEHGEILEKYLDALIKRKYFRYILGETNSELREKIKNEFEDKKILVVIATRVWSEGVNIRSVDVVINAAGGESEIAAIQKFGRGMRKAKGKEEVVLVDFIDVNHQWFIKHSLKRICTYSRIGWL